MTQISPASRVVHHGVRIALATGLAAAITACTPTGDFVLGSRDAAAEGPAPISARPDNARDVEAPEVFDVTGEGLWDGRPSLGGVWVAHPEASDPERVIIRNSNNDRFVIGALFRRERDNPGPPIQVSSEAAAALGLLAGDPAALQVTALRREEQVAPEPAETVAATEPGTTAPEPAPAPIDSLASAPAEDAADGPDVPALGAAAATATTTATAATSAAATAAPAGGAFLAALSRVFGPVAEPAASATPARTPDAEPEPAPAAPRNMSADDIASGIETAAFSTAALAPPPASDIPSPAPLPVAAAAPRVSPLAPPPESRVPAPARTPQTSLDTPLSRAFVQVGLFSVQENAEAADRALRRAGLVPTIRTENGNGTPSWRVLVGQAPTAEDRAAVLDTVRGAGFEDAYFVSR
jgi:hypothetical protein